MADQVAELEKSVQELEVANAQKDEVIASLEGGDKAAPADDKAAAEAPAAAPAGPPAAPPALDSLPEDAKELVVYDDDKALGAEAPSLASLKFFNGEPFDVKGGDKVSVITWHCNLNKSDYVTLSVLSDVYQKYKDQANFVAISRDHEQADVEKWLKKYNGTFMAEQKGPNGEAGITARCDFPMAFDEGHAVNNQYKVALKKAVVGVGMVIVVDKEGKIAWYETFVRGANPVGQFETQLYNLVNGKELLKNGPAPEVKEEEVEGEQGAIPDDVDFLGGGDGNY